MAKMQKLWCEHGKGHHWKRPSQRGKPPKFCPKHKPEPVVVEKKKKFKTLQCAEGHKWKWERRGGFEPKWCPEHRPAKQSEAQYEDLHCVNGNHTWSRLRQRGKKPTNCPLHSGNPERVRGGLGALKARKLPQTNGKEPVLKGLAKLRAKRRTGLRGLQSKVQQRKIAESKTHLENSAQRYEAALEHEREIFAKLDKLENSAQRYEAALEHEREIFAKLDKLERKKKRSALDERRIDTLKYEWEIAWRKLNNEYNTNQNLGTSYKRIANIYG